MGGGASVEERKRIERGGSGRGEGDVEEAEERVGRERSRGGERNGEDTQRCSVLQVLS